jgi:hypothetical protein
MVAMGLGLTNGNDHLPRLRTARLAKRKSLPAMRLYFPIWTGSCQPKRYARQRS